MLNFLDVPVSFPQLTFDITSVVGFWRSLWNLFFSGLNNIHLKFGNIEFSVFGLFVALMTLFVVASVVLNIMKSSAVGAEKSVSRADQTVDDRKKYGRVR